MNLDSMSVDWAHVGLLDIVELERYLKTGLGYVWG